ncbi:FAD/NAD(P)-binding domain-containing protein [Hypomontagnella monticulosa]|nr:FAD/NAD(P)-binding domain-containing protein [Hypomontagnella monticulosa]
MGSTPSLQPPFQVQKVAVIGAGPSGLAAAKYLLAQEGAFPCIDVFEQQAEVGGVWNYSAVPRPAETVPVPQTDAHPPRPDPPVYVSAVNGSKGEGGDRGVPLFPSPMYDDLHTNIPHTLMKYSDLGFPEGCEIFPTREAVQEYLVEYAKDIRHLIKFSTQVTDIRLRQDEQGRDQWDVSTTDLLSGKETQETYDAVVVASGHYSTPYIPDGIEGIKEWNAAYPGVISHSKVYRNAEAFRGKKVVVVGTGASGLDIASQILRVCKPPLLLSAQSGAPAETLAHLGPNVQQVGQIDRFLIEERGVEFSPLESDNDDNNSEENDKTEGKETRIEKDIDAILYCTGYLYTFPSLNTFADPPLITDGRRVHGLAKHFLHINHPTIAFLGLPIKVIPFPLSEAQGAVLARLWSNTLPLPSQPVLEEWERTDGDGTKPGKYHVFPKGGDGRYINGLHDWLKSEKGSETKGRGKEPPYWDKEMLWQRGVYAEAKLQFEKTGKKAKTLEELGFKYEPEDIVKSGEDVEAKDPQLDTAG